MTIVLFSYCITTLHYIHKKDYCAFWMHLQHYSLLFGAEHNSSKNIRWFKWNTVSFCMTKTNRDVAVFLCIANIFDLLLFSKDVYSLKCVFANNLNQYITSWSKSPFRWLNGNESISWRHRKCFSKLCVHRMRTKTPNRCADLLKRTLIKKF